MPTEVRDRFGRVAAAEKRASFKNLGHAAAVVRKVAVRSIKAGKRVSKRQSRMGSSPAAPAGTPPHSPTGRLKRAILFAQEPEAAVIGPSADLFGNAGKAHEFGGRFRRETFERRPFMGPALEKVQDQIPAQWAGTIRE